MTTSMSVYRQIRSGLEVPLLQSISSISTGKWSSWEQSALALQFVARLTIQLSSRRLRAQKEILRRLSYVTWVWLIILIIATPGCMSSRISKAVSTCKQLNTLSWVHKVSSNTPNNDNTMPIPSLTLNSLQKSKEWQVNYEVLNLHCAL